MGRITNMNFLEKVALGTGVLTFLYVLANKMNDYNYRVFEDPAVLIGLGITALGAISAYYRENRKRE